MWNACISEDLNNVDKYIKESLKSSSHMLTEAISDLVSAGGKRLRPALLLLSARLGEYDSERLVPIAASIEILHMATLVHDDIIDEEKLRRGKSTVQSRWGKDVAVFAGDFLFSKSFLIMSQKITINDIEKVARAIQAICQGEINQFESRFSVDVSVNKYLKRIARKTALMFALSCRVGAEESKCSEKIVSNVTNFGKSFGMAFQITDDLLDVQGNQEVVGKPLLSDFVQGVYTLPVIYTLQNYEYRDKIMELARKDHLDSEDLDRLQKWIKDSGGLKYSRNLADRYIKRAEKHINKLPDLTVKASFKELLDQLLERRS